MTTLYASDLDGTLLGPDARLSATTVDMLHHLVSAGALITFITARTPATVSTILQPADLRLPGVVMTGAAVWNNATKAYESVNYFDPADVRAIQAVMDSVGLQAFAVTLPKGSNCLQLHHPGKSLNGLERQYVIERIASPYKHFTLAQPQPVSTYGTTVLFFAMGQPGKIRQAAEAINATGCAAASPYPDLYHPGVALLEVFPGGVSKANGLLQLKEMLGADRVVAFGDNLNDLPMMKVADVAVAVDNAHYSVKAAADIVIGPNTADAVPQFILSEVNSRE